MTQLKAIAAQHSARAPAEWFYKPVSIELELLERCNLRCTGCAVIDAVERDTARLSVPEALSVLRDAWSLGLYTYNLTGGEPFLALDEMCEIIAGSELDVFKIQTNGGVFTSVDRAEKILLRLEEAGFARKNRWLKPSINISFGMQTEEGVPLRNIAAFTKAFLRVFGDRALFQLNLLPYKEMMTDYYLYGLEEEYRTLAGAPYPMDKVTWVKESFFDYTPRLAERGMIDETTSTVRERVAELPRDFRCFTFSTDDPRTPVPRILVRADGTMFPCSCFGHVGSPGNIRATSLRALLDATNRDPFLRAVYEGGLPRLAELVDPRVLELELPVRTSICKVCKALREPDRPLFEPLVTINKEGRP